MPGIAIVGAGCRYPDAADPDRLWELVLAGRRAFRPVPPGRLDLGEYGTGNGPDGTYLTHAAVLDGWDFDRGRYRIPGSVHRVTDLTHWLALDVAADTLESAGFPDGKNLDRDRAGVILGNTLTGEFTRTSLLRLRWPYVRRVVAGALGADGVDPGTVTRLLGTIEHSYKEPFSEPNEESLAGGLANTIAGRICNQFDLHGGGFTVDGACASSLLAVITACRALTLGELDFALAGGVDLSLDPFEMVGFARTGALATTDMRVYDADPTGFWPGEGCGIIALMRAEDAEAAGRPALAVIKGWGVSSDGHGGLTRPAVAGQRLALDRAYRMARFPVETVALFEGHGTGTAVGDRAELETVIAAHTGRREVAGALGSIKANIGHTKAAAGAAGLLKAVLALQHQVIPPTTGCQSPHELLAAAGTPVRVVGEAEPWPEAPRRAAVNALGFGGINTHLVLEGTASHRSRGTSIGPALDAELFAFGADTAAELDSLLSRAAEVAARMSFAEHIDLAASLAGQVASLAGQVASRTGQAAIAMEPPRLRMAITARDPGQLHDRLLRAQRMLTSLAESPDGTLLTGPGLLGGHGAAGKLGLLFTGQAAPVRASLGALAAMLPDLAAQLPASPNTTSTPSIDTAVAQPAIFRSSMAGLRWLHALGVEAAGAVGHSLGEISALCWADSLSEADATELVEFRGQVMSHNGTAGTGMASIVAGPERVGFLTAGTSLVIAAYNGPSQVVAGPLDEIERVLARADEDGIIAHQLPVSHAFHSPAMTQARPILARRLSAFALRAPRSAGTVYSTVTGRELDEGDDLRELLVRQLTAPVLFRQAVTALAADCTLLLEVGPGHSLATLASEITGVPAFTLDVGTRSADSLCTATAALYAAGLATDLRPLFAARFHRDFDLWREPRFLVNPCDASKQSRTEPVPQPAPTQKQQVSTPAPGTLETVATAVRRLIADAAELPADAIGDRDLMLSDLHLSSLRVTQIATNAAVQCGRLLSAGPPPLADASVADLIAAVEALPQQAPGAGLAADSPASGEVESAGDAGLPEWHRVFVRELGPAEVGGPRYPYHWQVYGCDPLGAQVEPLLAPTATGPTAVLVVLPADPCDDEIATLIHAARAAAESASLFAIADYGDTASGFLATIGQEYPGLATRWVSVPEAPDLRARIALASALALRIPGHTEFVIDEAGRRHRIAYRPAPGLSAPTANPLSPADVILVTGGGRGIGFSSAAALAAAAGAKLALIGRSDPDGDAELRENLGRLREAGVSFRYCQADVTDPAAVRDAVAAFAQALGPVTAVVHSSGRNDPARFSSLADEAFDQHAAPKVLGLRTLVEALDTQSLRMIITYGSVIGRFGLPGEAHYALANGRMRELARVLAARLPQCWVCDIDWTAWSGTGMGERLGVLDALRQTGVVPIPEATANDLLIRLVAARPATHSVVVSGRLPQLSDRTPEGADDAAYLRQIVAHVPGTELVAEADLSLSADEYLTDHRIDGLCVLPAVCALEAMAEAARILTGAEPAGLADATFDRPVIVPDDGTTTIRVSALTRPDGDVDVVLRSSETAFSVDHFSARVTTVPAPPPHVPGKQEQLPPHNGATLYGPLFFHGPAFQRVRRYEELSATSCSAVLAPSRSQAWRGPLRLGDPATNDASIHVLQGCVPHRRLLPVGCERFSVHSRLEHDGEELMVCATERAHQDADYTYDVVVTDVIGRPLFSWTGLRLRDVGPLPRSRWPLVLLGSYLQRSVGEIMPGREACVEVRTRNVARVGHPADDGSGGQLVLATPCSSGIVSEWAPVTDGQVSTAAADHAQLGQLRRFSREPGEYALARLLTARACLDRLGGPARALRVHAVYERGWIMLRAGNDDVMTTVLEVEGQPRPVVVAIAVRGEQ